MPYLTRRYRPSVQPKGGYRLAPNVLAAFVGGNLDPHSIEVPAQGSLINLREGIAYYNAAAASSATFGKAYAPLHTRALTMFVMGWWTWGGTASFRTGVSGGLAFSKAANAGRFTITPGGYSFNPATLNSYTFSANPTFRKVVGQFDPNAAEVRGWTDNGVSDTRAQTGSYTQASDNTVTLSVASSSLDRIQVAVLFAGIVSPWDLFANPWGWVRPVQRARTYFFPVASGGGVDLVINDASHGHSADGATLTQQHQLAVQDAAHAHAADSLTLTQQHALVVADAAHGHAADNLTLSTEIELSIADALHGHSTDSITLVQQHVLVVADAAHGHSADSVVLETGATLAIADASHAHAADNLVLTQQHVLVVADALHGHSADSIVLVDPDAQVQQQTLGGRGSRGLLDLDTDAHIRAVEELHEARLKQRQAEQPAPVVEARGRPEQPQQIEQPKTAKTRKRKSQSAVLPSDVIAAGIDPEAQVTKQPAKVEATATLPAKVQQVEAADAVNDDEFAIVLAQFLLAA